MGVVGLTVLTPRLPVLMLVAAGVLACAVVVLPRWYRHPQVSLLLLAALVPFDGLLLLVPHPAIVEGWKEALVLSTAIVAVLSPRATAPAGRRVPVWALAAAGLLTLAVLSALVVGPARAVPGLKIGYFYLLIPLVLWRHPFTARDRDRLVTILMSTAVIVSLYGLFQQALGPVRLNAIGYEYNTAIRFAGNFLRTFSSFVQPFPFALYVMVALLIGVAVALADRRRARNLAFLLFTPVMVVAMASSIVRASYLGLVVGLLVLAWARYRLLALLPIALAAVVVLLPSGAVNTAFSSSSLGERQSGWEATTSLVLAHPWGVGVGATGAAAEKVAASVDAATAASISTYQPDNFYFKMLVELGVLGLWLFAVVIVSGFVWSLTIARRTRGPDGAMALGVAATMAAVGVASIFATYLEIFPMDVLFWLWLGVLTCIPRVDGSGSTPLPSAQAGAGSRPISGSSSLR